MALLLVGIKFYPNIYQAFHQLKETKEIIVTENNDVENENPTPIVKEEKHRDLSLEDEFPMASFQKEFAEKHPDQFAIVEKMYYAWDNLNNVQGVFKWGYDSNKQNFRHITFAVNFDTNQNIATTRIYENGIVTKTTTFLLTNSVTTFHSEDKKLYAQEPISDKYDLNNSIGQDHSNITHSEWFALIFDNYDDWDYEESTAFGIPTYHIKGTIDTDISNTFAGPFEMTVAKDTGVLLDLKCFGDNVNNEMVFFVTVEEISINEGINDSDKVFNLGGLSNYKKVSPYEFGQIVYGNSNEEKTGWDS